MVPRQQFPLAFSLLNQYFKYIYLFVAVHHNINIAHHKLICYLVQIRDIQWHYISPVNAPIVVFNVGPFVVLLLPCKST